MDEVDKPDLETTNPRAPLLLVFSPTIGAESHCSVITKRVKDKLID